MNLPRCIHGKEYCRKCKVSKRSSTYKGSREVLTFLDETLKRLGVSTQSPKNLS